MLPYLTLATVRGPAPSGQVATETIDSVVANYGATIASERMRGNVYFVTTLAALGAAIFYRYKASVGQETPRRGHERAASRGSVPPAPRAT